jgi:hypothetical protein
MKAIFIGGCDRSGTTLLGAMLGSSPGAICTPESQFKTEILEHGEANRRLASSRLAFSAIVGHWRYAAWGLSQSDLLRLRARRHSDYGALLKDIVLGYAESLGYGKGGQALPQFWVDHTPSNIRHLDRLFSIFPDAVCLHIVRDGRAVAASVIPLDWGPSTIFFAARWWARQLSPGLAAEQYFGPKRVLRVRYEDLLAAPEAELKKICRFAGIEYVDAMCSASGFRIPRYTASQHSRLDSGKIKKSRACRWRKVLAPKQVAVFEYATGDLLAYLGYRLEQDWPARPPSASLIAEGVRESVLWMRNRVRRRKRKRRHLRL